MQRHLTEATSHSGARIRAPRRSIRPGRAATERSLRDALDRQARCRDAYRRVLGSAYEADAYSRLLASTRDVVRIRAELARIGDR